ncbi:F-box protein [Apostasia shenzhenica]|uniref:F-box protein n=1 Tax=Apostasia shenzhenica TaxID=1088818 RepID=A0A2I0ASD1_9ASPA|nr:F-box protein [Apostasia shenzhenica]
MKEEKEMTAERTEKNRASRWQHEANPDILSLISDFLPLPDFINFRAVCRAWRDAPHLRRDIAAFCKANIWCILYDFQSREEDDDICFVYELSSDARSSFRIPALRGSTCLASKQGWLLLRRSGDHSYFFFNPFTLTEIPIQPYPRQPPEVADQVGEFSSPPTSRDCTVFLVSSRGASTLEVAWCSVAEGNWVIDLINTGDRTATSVLRNRDAFCCTCCESWSCQCRNRGMLFIHEWDMIIMYDTTTRKPEYQKRQLPTKAVLWYSKLKEAHSVEWKKKFGEGMILSFPSFSCSEKKHEFMGLVGTRYRISRTTPSKGDRLVKATWIEPTFQ